MPPPNTTPPPRPPSRSPLRTRLTLLALALCCGWFLWRALAARAELIADPARVASLSQGDASHYLDIAREFGDGDLRMGYVKERAHRQPLYPAALAVSAPLLGHEPSRLLLVNIVILTLAVFAAGLGCWRLFDSELAGLTAATLLASSSFLLHEGALRLLTEPLFTLCLLGAVLALLRHFESPQRAAAVRASAWFGLAYLTRPNGLFLFFAAFSMLSLEALLRWRRDAERGSWRNACSTPLRCAVVFVAVTLPSWLPRLCYQGNAFYHGYLPNYLWVDSYAEGHVAGDPRFTIWDYVRDHTLSDAWHRLLHGLHAVFVDVPMHVLDGKASLLMAAGVVMALLLRRRALLLLLVIFLIQILPIVWTQMSNPSTRIPAAATLPFGIFYAAFAVSVVQSATRKWWSRHRGPPDGTL